MKVGKDTDSSHWRMVGSGGDGGEWLVDKNGDATRLNGEKRINEKCWGVLVVIFIGCVYASPILTVRSIQCVVHHT